MLHYFDRLSPQQQNSLLGFLNHEQYARVNSVGPAIVANTITIYTNGGLSSVSQYWHSVNSDQARRNPEGRTETRIIELACAPAPQ